MTDAQPETNNEPITLERVDAEIVRVRQDYERELAICKVRRREGQRKLQKAYQRGRLAYDCYASVMEMLARIRAKIEASQQQGQ